MYLETSGVGLTLIQFHLSAGNPPRKRLFENLASMVSKGDEAQRLCGSLQVDISKARALLGWTPPFSVEDGLKATALGLKGD